MLMFEGIVKLFSPIWDYFSKKLFTNKNIDELVEALYLKDEYLSFDRLSNFSRDNKKDYVFDKLIEDMWRGFFENKEGETVLRYDESVGDGPSIKIMGKNGPFNETYNRLKIVYMLPGYFKQEYDGAVNEELRELLNIYINGNDNQKGIDCQRHRLLKEVDWNFLAERIRWRKEYEQINQDIKNDKFLEAAFFSEHLSKLMLHKNDFKKWLKANWSYLNPEK